MRSLIALLLLVCCLGMFAGCDAAAGTDCQCPDCQCPDGVCPDCPACPPDGCPDGVCPADRPVSDATDHDVVDEARGSTEEAKGTTSDTKERITYDPEVKREGRYKCQRCKRSVVGKDWHNVWAGGAVATFLCEDCWQALNADEREAHLKAYLDRQKFRGDRQGLIEATRTGR